MKYVFFVIGIVILGGILFLGMKDRGVTQEAQEEMLEEKPVAVINGIEIELDVVRTPEEQTRGLSGRESLEANTGMLFVYETPAIPGFWMKEMNFPIDIIWIDENKKIIDITENLVPETFPQVFYPHSQILYVLEVNAGWAKNHNASMDDTVEFDIDF